MCLGNCIAANFVVVLRFEVCDVVSDVAISCLVVSHVVVSYVVVSLGVFNYA